MKSVSFFTWHARSFGENLLGIAASPENQIFYLTEVQIINKTIFLNFFGGKKLNLIGEITDRNTFARI
jgi:hypothetical protein